MPESAAARARCLEDAGAILDEGLRVFGRRVSTGAKESWTTDPLTNRPWPSDLPWWKLDIRTDQRLSDVKFVWEAARHRDLVVLARAAVLEPEHRWLPALEDLLRRWCSECPPERGVNWYSSLEVALRAIAWSQVLGLVGDRLASDLRREMDAQLVAGAGHIMLELPYTVSSMKNNHMLGDGLGLTVIGRMFPSHPKSPRWIRVGDRVFQRQLRRHVRPDGSTIEDSLSYHRFVLEMLIVHTLLGDASPDVRDATERAAENLRQLGAVDGPVPQFGDWDEGRVLADSNPAGSVAGSTMAGLVLGGAQVDSSAWDEYDELAWYVPRPPTAGKQLRPLEAVRRAGYFDVLACGDWTVWVKTGTGPSHQHADLSAVWIMNGERWIVEDPGTGTYNGPLQVRNGFRTSAAHSVWRPRGEDQLGPHRAFRWLRSPGVYASKPIVTSAGVALLVWHDAFEDSGGKVARVVLVSDTGVLVKDFAEQGGNDWELTIPIAPDASPEDLWGLQSALVNHGQSEPFAGWRSDTYGDWQPATWLGATGLDDSFVWGVGCPEVAACSISWSPDEVRVLVDVDSGRELVASRA